MQSIESGGNWLLDVAHNPAAAQALSGTLRSTPVSGKTIAIVGMLDDKVVEGVISPLTGLVDHWIAVAAQSSRAVPAVKLGRKIANLSDSACLVAGSLEEAIDSARALAAPDDRILVTGSFYVVGPVLKSLALYSRPRS